MKKIGELIEKVEFYSLVAKAKRVFGPYTKKDSGRKIVIIIEDDGSRRTVSYPKFLLEQKLNRPLDSNTETVDHWDTDKDNNNLDNLRIVPRSEHSSDDTRRVKLLDLDCAMCGKPFQRSPRIVRDKSNKGQVSAFCSRNCAGRHSRMLQLGLVDKLPVPPPPQSEYYKKKYLEPRPDNDTSTKKIESFATYLLEKYAADLSSNA